MRLGFVIAAIVLVCAQGWAPAAAQTAGQERRAPAGVSDEDLLLRLWNEPEADLSVFAPSFLAAVPEARIRATLAETRATYGEAISAAPSGEPGVHRVETATHTATANMRRDGDGLIVGLLLNPPVAKGAGLEASLKALEAPGALRAHLITRNGEVVAEHRAGEPMAIGSAFKLFVLDGLQRRVEAGEAAWDEVTTLDAAHRSLPSGLTQDWPAGSPVTLHTLALLMISMSDNTATDHLIDFLGRESLDGVAGAEPFLTTAEFFKFKADPALAGVYEKSDATKRREILAGLAERSLPHPSEVIVPQQPGIEWYASAEELCAVIGDVAGLELTGVRPGVADPGAWAKIAFKGGSEIGVLNLTQRLTAKDGTTWCVALTWNDTKALDEAGLLAAAAGLVQGLAEQGEGSPAAD